MSMEYKIGDQFLLGDMIVEVRYINNGMAWIAPIEDSGEGPTKRYSAVVFDVLDEEGLDRDGNQATFVKPEPSSAI